MNIVTPKCNFSDTSGQGLVAPPASRRGDARQDETSDQPRRGDASGTRPGDGLVVLRSGWANLDRDVLCDGDRLGERERAAALICGVEVGVTEGLAQRGEL